jgi:hypothetical protein
MLTVGEDLLALHALAVKKSGSPAAIAELLGSDETAVAQSLENAQQAGHAIGARETFMVTPAGRTWLEAQYPHAFGWWRANEEARAAYDRFEKVNRRLLALFTDWQMIPVGGQRVPNQHDDEEYDGEIVARLGSEHERAQRPLSSFEEVDARMAQYGRRLDCAYEHVVQGNHEFLSGVQVDSYHTVWFELHEDLLRMLGLERSEEPGR